MVVSNDIFVSSLVEIVITTLLLAYYILLLWTPLAFPVGKTVSARICKRLRSPGLNSMEPIPRTGLCYNHIFCSGPPGYIGWLNRFLGSLKVYKFGLRAEFSFKSLSSHIIHSDALHGARLPLAGGDTQGYRVFRGFYIFGLLKECYV
jgi:hypothetical protein